MNELIKTAPMPAHLANASNRLNLNAAAHAGIQASFAVISTFGKDFRVRHHGHDDVLKDREMDVVVVGMAAALSKKFYLGAFDQATSKGKAPDCFSINGISPDPASAHKQSAHCATCPNNAWGSSNMPGSKAKACRDGRRLAIVPAGNVDNDIYDGPMLMDVPPASLKPLDKYVTYLDRMGADISQVVTKIEFNPNATHELAFSFNGWIQSPEDYDTVCEHGQSEQVRRMLEAPLVEVTYDPASEELPPPPAHIPPRQAPGAVLKMTDVAQAALEAKAAQVAAAAAEAMKLMPTVAKAAPPPVGEIVDTPAPPANTTVVKKTSPFRVQSQAPAPPPPVPPAMPEPPAMVQGAPPSMQDAIDNLLN